MNYKKVLGTTAAIVGRIVLYAVVIYVVYYIAIGGYQFGYRVFHGEPVDSSPGKEISFTLETGTSTMQVARQLEEKGLIGNKYLFYLQVKLSRYNGKFQPGTYILNTSMDAEMMMSVLSNEQSTEENEE